MKLFFVPVLVSAAMLYSVSASAATVASTPAPEYTFTITKERKLSPPELIIPAHKQVKLTIKNMGDRQVEFESVAITREKNVPAHGQAVMYVGPLDPGSYNFFDEIHRGSLNGTITAKENVDLPPVETK